MSSTKRNTALTTRRTSTKRAPTQGVIKGWPSAEILHREAEIRARRAKPYLLLEGDWLRACGFEVGQPFVVSVEQYPLVVTIERPS
jgi:hypothetical protein